MNKVILLGNVGADVETRFTNGGHAVTNISLATSKQVKDKKVTEWHKVITWNKLAENCGKYLKKGSKILVEGEICTRSWEDKDGQRKYSTEILAHGVQFISGTKGKDDVDHPEMSSGGKSFDGSHGEIDLEDIPF